MTGNAGGTKLTAGTAGATGIFFHGKKRNKQLQYLQYSVALQFYQLT